MAELPNYSQDHHIGDVLKFENMRGPTIPKNLGEIARAIQMITFHTLAVVGDAIYKMRGSNDKN